MKALRTIALTAALVAMTLGLLSAWFLAGVPDSVILMERARAAGVESAGTLDPGTWRVRANGTYAALLALSVLAVVCSLALLRPRRWARTGLLVASAGLVVVAGYWAFIGDMSELVQLAVVGAAVTVLWWLLFRSPNISPLFSERPN